ncbi:MAG: hypothetical protein KJS97_05820 [Alphaproteobacteria bacterium]|nr:hypothetical protein [Alphaproteobacteria bacterium]
MRAAWFALVLVCLSGAIAPPPIAHAAETQRAASGPLAAYASGRFLEAAEAAARSPTAEDRALAARALLAACVLEQPDRRSGLVAAAEAQARAALAADPDSVDARLQLAMALGLKGRRASLGEALRRGYASEAKRLIDEATLRDPSEPWGWALLGGWNLEVVRRGGRLGARIYGASTAKGLAAFERAHALAPQDPVISLHFAAALLGVDAQRYGPRAQALLATAIAAPAPDAFTARMRAEAETTYAALTRDGPAVAAARIQGRI